MLAVGFTLSAVTMYATLSAIGSWVLGNAHSGAQVWSVAAITLVALFALDVLRARSPDVLGPSWRRQTPKWLLDRYSTTTAAFLWGLDTGLVFTTFRVGSLSWAALGVTALGLVPWWVGIVYALGFSLPLASVILVVPRRTDPTGLTDPEPVWLVHRLFRFRVALKPLGLAVLGMAWVSCLITAMLRAS
jgi:hypothetical protein